MPYCCSIIIIHLHFTFITNATEQNPAIERQTSFFFLALSPILCKPVRPTCLACGETEAHGEAKSPKGSGVSPCSMAASTSQSARGQGQELVAFVTVICPPNSGFRTKRIANVVYRKHNSL